MEIEKESNVKFSADFQKRYEKVITAVHKHSSWLNWFGLTYMIVAAIIFIVKSAQMWRIFWMSEMLHGNNNK